MRSDDVDLGCSAGPMPDARMPTVLASTRLTEVRGFSDFCSEFFQVSQSVQDGVR